MASGTVYKTSTADATFVPQTRTVNGHALTGNVTVTASDVSAAPVNAWEFRVSANGAVGDGALATDVATNGTNTFTSATISAQGSGAVGKWVMINGARSDNLPAIGTITGVSGTSVTISTTVRSLPITATATGLNAVWGTDDTTAINNTVSAARTYAEAHEFAATVVFDDKIYIVSGNTQSNDGNYLYNCGIPVLAPTNNSGRKLVLGFKGAARADHLDYWNAPVPALGATVIVSTQTSSNPVDATWGVQSVFGAPYPQTGLSAAVGQRFINHKPVFQNIQVVVPLLTNLTGYDFTGSCGVYVDGCATMAFAQGSAGNGPNLAGQWGSFGSQVGCGMRLPGPNNNADTFVPAYAAIGLCTGLSTPSEHTLINVYRTLYSCVALEVTNSTSGHGLVINHVTAEAYQGGLKCGGGNCPVFIHSWSTEDSGTVYDVHDPGNALRGEIHWYDTLDGSHSKPIVDSGGANVRVINETLTLGTQTAPAVPATTVALVNPFYRDARVRITGGTVTNVTVGATQEASATGVNVTVPTGKSITLTYSVAPTWTWETF